MCNTYGAWQACVYIILRNGSSLIKIHTLLIMADLLNDLGPHAVGLSIVYNSRYVYDSRLIFNNNEAIYSANAKLPGAKVFTLASRFMFQPRKGSRKICMTCTVHDAVLSLRDIGPLGNNTSYGAISFASMLCTVLNAILIS